MATSASTIYSETGTPYRDANGGTLAVPDRAESILQSFDESTQEATGISLLHLLTLGSIAASIGLFFAGKKQTAIFIGLWPPTFQALKAAVDSKKSGR